MRKERFFPINLKLTLGIIIVSLMFGLISVLSVKSIATNIIDKEYKDKAEQVSLAVASNIDEEDVAALTDAVMEIYGDGDDVVLSTEWGSDEWNAYIAKYEAIEEMPEFIRLRDEFRKYQDIFKVDCIYIVVYPTDNRHGIYIVDGDYEDACPPGCVDSFEDGIWPTEENPVVEATITNEAVYGALVTAGYPVLLKKGLVGDLCVDISMDEIQAKEQRYVITSAVMLLMLMIAVLIFSIWYVNLNIVKPVGNLSDTAKNYCSESNDVVHHSFENLQFKTHDEIAELLAAMKQMEADMNANINTLISTKVELRDSVEKATKDALTGIRNKMAYDDEVRRIEREIAAGNYEFGLAMIDLNFLKKTNDTYGHEKGNISIRRLSMLVCEVFYHSPVYRVGGDEFIVVLRNNDYRKIDELVEEFNNHLAAYQADASLEPWEKISAAIGYYKFDRFCDKTVEDVFKKADKAMYERKQAMKAQRKD